MPVTPPFIWPEARFHAGLAHYTDVPPARNLFTDADLISGLLVGAADRTIGWLEELLQVEGKRRICLVLVQFPAGPTREEHLRAIHELQASFVKGDKALEVRLLPMARHFDGDCKRASLPPTVIQAYNTRTGRTVMSIGSGGDAGHDPVVLGSLNLVLHTDDAHRDAWRRWFQYVFSSAAHLTEDTLQIPHLVPAKGDPEAARLWEAFELACQGVNPAASAGPTVDPETGEVKTDADGKEIDAWDEGKTALDPLAQIFQQVYANGWLVTVDEATRVKPLTIPVKATLLGQQSERTVGALKQKQSFTLQVLDDKVDKAIEKCRKVTDVIELLTYPLSQGNRWLPEAAKGLLEKELESRNEEGKKALRDALGGDNITAEGAKSLLMKQFESPNGEVKKAIQDALGGDTIKPEVAKSLVEKILLGKELTKGDEQVQKAFWDALLDGFVERFIATRTDSIREDLNGMYRQLGQGDAVPKDKLKSILDEVKHRLKHALETRITPRAIYNRIGAPDLTVNAPDENWNQPLSLLLRSAHVLRESLVDRYFSFKLSGRSFSEEEFREACNPFEDPVVTQPNLKRAKDELQRIDAIISAGKPTKEKCQEVWRLIRDRQQETRGDGQS